MADKGDARKSGDQTKRSSSRGRSGKDGGVRKPAPPSGALSAYTQNMTIVLNVPKKSTRSTSANVSPRVKDQKYNASQLNDLRAAYGADFPFGKPNSPNRAKSSKAGGGMVEENEFSRPASQAQVEQMGWDELSGTDTPPVGFSGRHGEPDFVDEDYDGPILSLKPSPKRRTDKGDAPSPKPKKKSSGKSKKSSESLLAESFMKRTRVSDHHSLQSSDVSTPDTGVFTGGMDDREPLSPTRYDVGLEAPLVPPFLAGRRPPYSTAASPEDDQIENYLDYTEGDDVADDGTASRGGSAKHGRGSRNSALESSPPDLPGGEGRGDSEQLGVPARPQSRKLYLGSEKSTRPTPTIKAPRSAGARYGTYNPLQGGSADYDDDDAGAGGGGGEGGSRKTAMKRLGSLDDLRSSQLWKNEDHAKERPPSRQSSAFPVHLADGPGTANSGNRDDHDTSSPINNNSEGYSVPTTELRSIKKESKAKSRGPSAGTSTGRGSAGGSGSVGGGSVNGVGSGDDNDDNGSLNSAYQKRPPSRQKIAAQHLFDSAPNSAQSGDGPLETSPALQSASSSSSAEQQQQQQQAMPARPMSSRGSGRSAVSMRDAIMMGSSNESNNSGASNAAGSDYSNEQQLTARPPMSSAAGASMSTRRPSRGAPPMTASTAASTAVSTPAISSRSMTASRGGTSGVGGGKYAYDPRDDGFGDLDPNDGESMPFVINVTYAPATTIAVTSSTTSSSSAATGGAGGSMSMPGAPASHSSSSIDVISLGGATGSGGGMEGGSTGGVSGNYRRGSGASGSSGSGGTGGGGGSSRLSYDADKVLSEKGVSRGGLHSGRVAPIIRNDAYINGTGGNNSSSSRGNPYSVPFEAPALRPKSMVPPAAVATPPLSQPPRNPMGSAKKRLSNLSAGGYGLSDDNISPETLRSKSANSNYVGGGGGSGGERGSGGLGSGSGKGPVRGSTAAPLLPDQLRTGVRPAFGEWTTEDPRLIPRAQNKFGLETDTGWTSPSFGEDLSATLQDRMRKLSRSGDSDGGEYGEQDNDVDVHASAEMDPDDYQQGDDVTIMTEDSGNEAVMDQSMSMQSFQLESSLGEEFLSLFAPAFPP